MSTRAFRPRNFVLIAALCGFLLPSANAELISTDQVASAAKIRADREKIRAFVNRAAAQQSLQAMGVKPESAKQRVDALTDEEVETIAGKIDALPAGGNLSNMDSRLLIVIVAIVAIVLII
jgi:Family of unknown function (DUF6627)